MLLAFSHISFAYEGTISTLLEDVTAHFPAGWTGIVGANGAGKTTVLQLAAGTLLPQQGIIKHPECIVFCPQRTDDPPAHLRQFLASMEADACEWRGKLRISIDWAERWPTLSHGERKRAQIATALWQQPEVLLIDEPTNHIDADARALLIEALTTFHGIGLLVSHDRELLDALCRQCLFLDPPQAVMRPGNYSEATAEARREEESLLAERHNRKQQLERLTHESQRRDAEAARAEQKKSKRRLARGGLRWP